MYIFFVSILIKSAILRGNRQPENWRHRIYLADKLTKTNNFDHNYNIIIHSHAINLDQQIWAQQQRNRKRDYAVATSNQRNRTICQWLGIVNMAALHHTAHIRKSTAYWPLRCTIRRSHECCKNGMRKDYGTAAH